MSAIRLPEGITIARLLDTFGLRVVELPVNFETEIASTDIRILRLAGKQDFVLPFPGREVSLQPLEGNGLLQMTMSNQLMPSPTKGDTSLAGARSQVQIVLTNLKSTWSAFCAEVESWLEREQGRILAVCEGYSQMLTERLSVQYGLSAVQDLQTILGYDVFLLDKQLDVVAWAGGKYLPTNPIPFGTPKLPGIPPGTPLSKSVNLFRGSWQDELFKDIPLTWCPLSGQQGVLGYLGLAAAHGNIGSVERFFLYKAATLLFLELLKNQCIQENERLHHRDFLFDLLYNNFDSIEVICSRGKLWGWDFTKPHFVLVGEIQDFSPLPGERQLLNDFIINITRTIRNLYPGSICLERNDQIVLLFPLQEMLSQSHWFPVAERFLKPIWKMTGAFFKDRKLFLGLGNLYPTAREIHRSFQEARSALELGHFLNPDTQLTPFRELGIMRLLQRLDHQELEDFRTETLRPLLDFDRDSNLKLEETLIAYFTSNGDLNAAAQKLFLHPNTLRYRLKKAAEVLDRDITHVENQLNLFVALKIGRLKMLWSE